MIWSLGRWVIRGRKAWMGVGMGMSHGRSSRSHPTKEREKKKKKHTEEIKEKNTSQCL